MVIHLLNVVERAWAGYQVMFVFHVGSCYIASAGPLCWGTAALSLATWPSSLPIPMGLFLKHSGMLHNS